MPAPSSAPVPNGSRAAAAAADSSWATTPARTSTVYFEGITSIGVRAFLRLAWATVPGFPMSLAIELSTLPDAALDAEPSGRAIFAVGHRFGDHLTVALSGSYGSRDFGLGSFGGGLQVGVEL